MASPEAASAPDLHRGSGASGSYIKLPCSSDRTLYIGWSLSWALLLLYVTVYTLWPVQTGSIVHCPLLSLTGLHCPACGLSRAAYALLHGELVMAAKLNLLVFPLAMAAVLFPLICMVDLFFGTRLLPAICRLPARICTHGE